MKKILAISLVVVMMAALAISAFAETDTKTDKLSQKIEVGQPAFAGQEYSQNITINNTVSVNEAEVYAVDIVWTNTTIEVETTHTKTWHPDSHTYSNTYETHWGNEDVVVVNVTNHSNVKVTAELTLPEAINDENKTINFAAEGNTAFDLESAAVLFADDADATPATNSFRIKPTGTIKASGEIVVTGATVTINKFVNP